ncbi:phosphotransferase [Peribacillus simplex]|uniref:phosphotransferase n=2 Tax=Bacillaceae TaxID=186817 RepID=UPI003D26A25F
MDGPCVVHMDFRPGNILVLNESKISGLIDFESAHGGPSEIDFTKIKQYVWDVYPETKEEFILGYKSIRTLPNL